MARDGRATELTLSCRFILFSDNYAKRILSTVLRLWRLAAAAAGAASAVDSRRQP
jgi:hypothetical protein